MEKAASEQILDVKYLLGRVSPKPNVEFSVFLFLCFLDIVMNAFVFFLCVMKSEYSISQLGKTHLSKNLLHTDCTVVRVYEEFV